MRTLPGKPPRKGKMKPMGEKGDGNLYSIVAVALLIIVVFAATKYFHDRDNDITVHLPRVEVH